MSKKYLIPGPIHKCLGCKCRCQRFGTPMNNCLTCRNESNYIKMAQTQNKKV